MQFIITILIIISIVSVKSDSKSDQINKIRKSGLKYFTKKPQLAYQSDIDLVEQKDWLIECFQNSIEKNNDPDKDLIKSLKAWKSDGILELNDTSFPSEFFALGHFYEFGLSKSGKNIIGCNWACAPLFRKIDSAIVELEVKFLSYIVRRVMFKSAEKNFIFFSNFGGPNWKDYDMMSIREYVRILRLHLPCFPGESYAYNLKGLVITVMLLEFSRLVPNYKTVSDFPFTETELEKSISLDEIPVHNGGRNTNFRFIPEGVKSGKCFPEFKNRKEIWDFLKDIRIDCLMQSLKISGKPSLEEFLNEC